MAPSCEGGCQTQCTSSKTIRKVHIEIFVLAPKLYISESDWWLETCVKMRSEDIFLEFFQVFQQHYVQVAMLRSTLWCLKQFFLFSKTYNELFETMYRVIFYDSCMRLEILIETRTWKVEMCRILVFKWTNTNTRVSSIK